MTKKPVAVAGDTLIVSVLKLIKERKIDDLVVTDENNVVRGFIDSQDLPGLKMM
jgi:CBS domain-containing protein